MDALATDTDYTFGLTGVKYPTTLIETAPATYSWTPKRYQLPITGGKIMLTFDGGIIGASNTLSSIGF